MTATDALRLRLCSYHRQPVREPAAGADCCDLPHGRNPTPCDGALMLQTFANRARETDLAKAKGRPDQGGPRSRKERSPKFVVDYAIQNGLLASRGAAP